MKTALLAFNGELMCFAHVLLNALDLEARGHEVTVVIEGSATKLVRELHESPELPFAKLYAQVKEKGLVDCVCRACSAKMGSKESAEAQGLRLDGEMSGHPAVARFVEAGYQVLVF